MAEKKILRQCCRTGQLSDKEGEDAGVCKLLFQRREQGWNVPSRAFCFLVKVIKIKEWWKEV